MPRPTATTRRGLTLLEVVLATVILAFVASVALGSLNYIIGQSDRQRLRLSAMELANRLMIIFLDNEHEFAHMPRNVEYEGRRYRFRAEETGVLVTPAATGDVGNALRSGERLRNIAIEVWLSEESGGTRDPEPQTPSARVVRLVDIFNPNPDTVDFTIKDDEARKEFIKRATRTQRGSASRPPLPRADPKATPGGAP